MARPFKNPTDVFGYEELALAGGMTRREIQHLMEVKEFIPPGRGIKALKRVASIGAFKSLGYSLYAAARISRALLDDFNQNDGELPSGVGHLVKKLPREASSAIPAGEGDYYSHLALWQHPDIYKRNQQHGSDAILEIINNRSIIHYIPDLPKPELFGWVQSINRGQDVVIEHLSQRLPVPNGHNSTEINHATAALVAETIIERDNAISRSIVNLSLAIRTALDRIADARAA